MRPKVNATSDSDLESVFSADEPLPNEKYVCSIAGCGQSFRRLVHLDRHEYKHTGVKKHPCLHPDCGKSYTISSHLKRHIKEFHEKAEKPKNVKCRFDFCERMFISEYNMERHIRDVHENAKVYTCLHCNEKFKQRIKLKRHEVKHSGIMPYICEKCNKGFVQECHFNRHVCKIYQCTVCEITFEKWSELITHRRKENHKEPIHKCEKCGKTFKLKCRLNEHNLIHEDDKDVFVCTHEGCKKFFSYQRNLTKHIRVTHEGLNFPCTAEGCKEIFKYKRTLDNHTKTKHCEKKVETKPKPKSKGLRALRKDTGSRKRSALSILSGVLIDKEVDKMIMEGTADIEMPEIDMPEDNDSIQEETNCPSDVEDPNLVVLELSKISE